MSSNDAAIRVEGLGKCYPIYARPQDRLKQSIVPRLNRLIGRPHHDYFREFWALRDVSFEVRKGETVGIIGRNGSGKSTLLQLICGTLTPTVGRVETNGRVAALLELGAGFNLEFTGRENVYLYGQILGIDGAVIERRFAEIAAFADIGDFIDQPVKTYSSGMFVRLAFSVIAHVDADILVIDEALAVGDVFFTQKCMRFLRGFMESGTVIFVSHDTASVLNLCTKALLLSGGGLRPPLFGDADELCRLYVEDLYSQAARPSAEDLSASLAATSGEAEARPRRKLEADMAPTTRYLFSGARLDGESFGDRGATIIDVGFFSAGGVAIAEGRGDEPVVLRISVRAHRRIVAPAFGFMIKNLLGEYLFTEGTDRHFRRHGCILEADDIGVASFSFLLPNLRQGKYSLNVAFAEGLGDEHIQHHWIHDAIQFDVQASRVAHGYCGLNSVDMSLEIVPAGEA